MRHYCVGMLPRYLVLLLIVVPNVCTSAQQTTSFDRAIAQAKRYVVPIICVGPRPNSQDVYLISIEGTGFFTSDDGLVFTAGHVGDALFSKGRIPACPIPAIYVPVDGWDTSKVNVDLRIIFIKGCVSHGDVDLAICLLAENPFQDPNIHTKPLAADLETAVQDDGTQVAFTGFPLSFIQPITSQGIIGTYRNTTDELGPRELVIDKNAWPGASGSPVYLANGKVVGIVVQRGFNDASGLAFARSSRIIKKFLEDTGSAKQQDQKNK